MAQITLNSTGVASNGSLVLQSNGTTAAVTIDTSQRAAFVAGTAALPAITTTGDTNTGMWFPAADTIAFSEGGAESMRIDSSGVGIGTASPSFASGGGLAIYNSSVPRLKFTNSTTGDASTDGTQLLVSGSDFYIQQREAASVFISTNGTNAVTVDASQNVGIGTSSLNQTGFTAPVLSITNGTSGIIELIGTQTADGTIGQIAFYNTSSSVRIAQILGLRSGANNSGALTFQTNNAGTLGERARITYDGNLLVGTTTAPAISGVPSNSFYLNSGTSGNWALGIQNTAASGGARGVAINYSTQTPNDTTSEPFFFSDSTAYRFSVHSNGGIANYSANNVNISDRREKTNFAPAKSYLDVICAIPVQTFNYIDQNFEEDDGLTLGVVAQDVQAVAPELVSESDWSPEKDGSKVRLSIYQTDLQYALMKCIQEQQALITALTARITALESI